LKDGNDQRVSSGHQPTLPHNGLSCRDSLAALSHYIVFLTHVMYMEQRSFVIFIHGIMTRHTATSERVLVLFQRPLAPIITMLRLGALLAVPLSLRATREISEPSPNYHPHVNAATGCTRCRDPGSLDVVPPSYSLASDHREQCLYGAKS